MKFEQFRWILLHEVALYFAPLTGAVKGIRRAHLAHGQQIKRAGLQRSFAPLVWVFDGILREYRALERLADHRRLTMKCEQAAASRRAP